MDRLSCAPKTFPCPQCGEKGRRKDVHARRVRDIAHGEIVVLEIEVGEYRASCCKTFRAGKAPQSKRACNDFDFRRAFVTLESAWSNAACAVRAAGAVQTQTARFTVTKHGDNGPTPDCKRENRCRRHAALWRREQQRARSTVTKRR